MSTMPSLYVMARKVRVSFYKAKNYYCNGIVVFYQGDAILCESNVGSFQGNKWGCCTCNDTEPSEAEEENNKSVHVIYHTYP